MIHRILTVVLLIFWLSSGIAQTSALDSLPPKKSAKFNIKTAIIPSVLIGYGIVGLSSNGIKSINKDIQQGIANPPHNKLRLDDVGQFIPTLTVYGLNAMNIKGKNNFETRTIAIATSFLIMGSTVYGLKKITKINRPDMSNNDSFPSGHTAMAFMGAEFLWQEYKDKSVWYGIAGYAVATGTAYLRMYNNKHWFTDVVTGAGVGIISTKMGYWLTPYIQQKLFKHKSTTNATIISPFYNGNQVGLNVSSVF